MEKANLKIGMSSFEALSEIIRANSNIEGLYFCVYEPHENVIELETKNCGFERLLYHDYPDPDLWSREDINPTNLLRFSGSLPKGLVLAVLSDFDSGESVYHLPLMDFYATESQEQLETIRSFIKWINLEGIILASGRSYHFYGSKPMNQQEWRHFLGNCLLSGLADPRYIGHRFNDVNEGAILRISACSLRPKVPTVVAIL